MTMLPEHERQIERLTATLKVAVEAVARAPNTAERRRALSAAWFAIHELQHANTQAEDAAFRATLAKLEHVA